MILPKKDTQEIQQIIEEKSDGSICGRFYNHQLKIEDTKTLKLKEKFFRYIPASFHNNRVLLSLFLLILFLTGCAKEKENCVATTGLVLIEEDTLPKNNDYIIGETLVENDSVAKMPKKDSLKLEK